MYAFYINLDRDIERRRFLEGEIAAAGIEVERVPGVLGADVPADLKDFFFTDGANSSGLRDAQIGCSASHLKVMRLIVERDLDAALVLEDDARLPRDLKPIIDEILVRLSPEWDLVRLCRAPKRAVRPLAVLDGGRTLVRYSRVPVGAAGYLVSRNGAKKILRLRKVSRPGDVEIAHPWELDLDVYGVVPPPVTQERKALPSTVSGKRGDLARIWRAMPSPKRVVFNMRKLGFGWWVRCLLQNTVTRHIIQVTR
jgi:glycosyl transferase family 25